jgi:hypothetical protein
VVNSTPLPAVRIAGPDKARVVAALLVEFNREYGTPTPEVDVLTRRLRRLLADRSRWPW